MAISGGSHGGFLTGNLLGRHADRFKAGLSRNPVMDLSLMIHVSDIPDWCYVEAWGVEVCACSFLSVQSTSLSVFVRADLLLVAHVCAAFHKSCMSWQSVVPGSSDPQTFSAISMSKT